MLNATLTPLHGFGEPSKDNNVDATITQAQPTPQNVTRAVYDYISTLRPGENVTSSDIYNVIKNVEPNAKISNVAAAMFHLRNEGAIEVIGTTKGGPGIGRAYRYKIIKSDVHEAHTFKAKQMPRFGVMRRTKVELASVSAERIELTARQEAHEIIMRAREQASAMLDGTAPLSILLTAMAGRAATEENEKAVLVANAKELSARPTGRLLSDATLPEIIAEMARRM